MSVTHGGDLPKADFTSHHIEGYARAAMEAGKTQGESYFDVPLISHIEGNLWVGGCLNGVALPDEFKHVISLYKWERYKLPERCDRVEIEMYDSGKVPDPEQLHQIADAINVAVKDGQTLVHCQAGLNRSNLVTALALIKNGMSPADAIQKLRDARSPNVLCNQAFENWLLYQDGEHEDELTALIQKANKPPKTRMH